MTTTDAFIAQNRSFIEWMLNWQDGLSPLVIDDLVGAGAAKTGIICVDIVKGFCTVGPLASPRIDSIVPDITALFSLAWERGIRDIALTQDTHAPDAVEFGSYAPHCVRGSEESETVEAFKALPFFDQLQVFEKNSIASSLSDSFKVWLDARSHIENWIIVGDCTDICIYQMAMHLRTEANELQIPNRRVILPVNVNATYDLPVDVAAQIGAVPHAGDFLHLTFLYHMMLNGVEIVREITA